MVKQQQSEDPAELRRKLRAERQRRRTRAATRQGLFYVFTVVALGGLYWYAQGDLTPSSAYQQRARVVLEEAQRTMLPAEEQSLVEPLGESDRRQLERQRGLVEALTRRHVGVPPAGGALSDLRLLQELVDDRVLSKDQTYELQALGVVLGDVMAEQLGLEWVIVDDEYGRSRALQYGVQDDFVFPVTMISRRYEAEIPVDVAALYEDIRATVEELRKRKTRGRS